MSVELSLEVPRDEQGPSLARSVVEARYGDELSPAQLGDLLVIVSELTTNAMLHGAGRIRLRVTLEDDRLYGEVIDEGSGFPTEVRERGVDELGGKGLLLVSALSDRWGIHEGSSHVWFEIGPDDERQPVEPVLGADERPPELE